MSEAKAIYQAFLDEIAVAIWDQRFEAAAEAMLYPHIISTRSRDAEVPDAETLIVMARAFHGSIVEQGATSYYRICREANFRLDNPTRIDGMHETYILRGANTLVPPFKGRMMLVHDGNRWLGAGIRSDIRNADVCINAPELYQNQKKI